MFQYPHAGEWPARGELLCVSPEHVSVLALKGAEEGPGLILRLFETAGRPADAEVALGDWAFTVSLGAHQIRTLRLHPEARRWQDVDLLEE